MTSSNTNRPCANTIVPATLQQLRDLVVAIKRGDAVVSLGNKALMVLGRLVDRPDIAAVKTITELARWLEVNPSTLSRLARTLGYRGFSDFQKLFRDEMTRSVGRFYSDQALRLLGEQGSVRTNDSYLNAIVDVSKESVTNIEGSLAQLDAGELRRVVAALARAGRIRLYGVRQIHAVVSVLAHGLGLIRPGVGMLGASGEGVAENLAHMKKGDVLVVSSVAPYSRSVVEAAEVAQRHGIRVVAITDYRTSPLTAHADHAFFIPHQSSFISNSIGAYIVFCEGLINLVAKELGAKALRSLERQEQFISDLRIEVDLRPERKSFPF